MKQLYLIYTLIILTISQSTVSWANGITVTLENDFDYGLFTACFDAKDEVFGIHCAQPGHTITKHYHWAPKIIRLQLRSGSLVNNPEKSFLTGECALYFPGVLYIDAWPKYSANYKTNAAIVNIRVWPGPPVTRHYGNYSYAATTWNCSWEGINQNHE